MKKFLFLRKDFAIILYIITTACFLLGGFSSCTVLKGPYNITPTNTYSESPVDTSKWINWNIMFSPRADSATRENEIKAVEDLIKNYLSLYNLVPKFIETYCPCDSSLFNLSVTPVQGSGGSYQAPPKQPPPPGASGDNFPYTVSVNNSLDIDMPKTDGPNQISNRGIEKSSKFSLDNNISTDDAKILAIMDTGLEPGKIDNINKIIWRDPNGRTLRNFFAFNNTSYPADYSMDDHVGKHGTAVTIIALQQMNSVPVYPRIMVLKVLDSNEKGSTFNIGCALSYAIQKNATIVNASLGYTDNTGIPDPVLTHYIGLCNARPDADSIFLFVAAGNLPQHHNYNLLCGIPTPSVNELKSTPGSIRLFYPACFSTDFHNVISITGLQDMKQSCVYQNYSGKFISLGVLNEPSGTVKTCCQFSLPALSAIYEGSSFATPIASGRTMAKILSTASAVPISVRQGLNLITNRNNNLLSVTRDGKFIGGSAIQ